MIRHVWQCAGCSTVTETVGTISEAPVGPHCCGSAMAKVWKAPQILLRAGTPEYKPLVAGRGHRHGISVDRELQMHKDQWAERASMARAKARSVRGSRRKDDEMKPIASVPLQLFAARTKEFGSGYWTDDPGAAVKREGLDFGV